jgi:hypothetical protein
VSNNGGKYGQMRPTLNMGCRTRSGGGYLAQNRYHSQPWLWCKVHSEVDKYFNGVL